MRMRLAENFRAVFYAPFYATLELGYFKREGIDVDFVATSGPGGGPEALLKGDAEITWGGPMRIMKARDENGPSYMCFCEVVRRDPFYLVGRGNAANFKLADLADARIGSVSEVPTPWLCLQHDLRDLGIDPTKLSRVADKTMAENLEAVEDGRLDIAQVFEPYAELALAKGLSILHAQAHRGDTSYTTLCGTRETIIKYKDAYAAMTRAVAGMHDWLHAHSGADLAQAVQSYYSGIDRAVLTAAFDRYKKNELWARDTVISRKGFDRLAVSLQSGGFIRKLPDYEDCVVDFLASPRV